MIAWILVALGQVAIMPEPEKRVDFKPETARMVNLAEPLGEALGAKVGVGENLRNEVLAVCAPNVTRKELAAKIAECLDADWRRDGTLLVLERSKAREEQMRQREIAYLVPKIRERQAEMMQALTKQGEFTPGLAKALSERVFEMVKSVGWANGNDLEAMARSTPQGRFAIRILASIPPEQVAAIPVGSKAIFRPNPNKRQLPLVLPKNAMIAFRRESDLFARAMSEFDLSPYERPGIGTPESLRSVQLGDRPVDLMVQISSSGANFYGSLYIVDAGGQTIATAGLTLETFGFPEAPQGGPQSAVQRGPLADELVRAYRAFRENKSFAVSPGLRAFLLRPDVHEPLSLGLTGAVRALATADGKAIVMRAWDTLFHPSLGLSRGSSASLAGFKQLLISQNSESLASGSWRILRPSAAWSSRCFQGDRESTARWLTSAERGGPQFEDTLNHFAAHSEGFGPYTMLWYRLLFPEKSDGHAYQVFGCWPKLLAALTPAQRLAISEGRSVDYVQLSTKAKAVVDELVFGMNGSLNTSNAPGISYRTPIRREPTEIFPGALPATSTLTGSHTLNPVVFGLFTNAPPGRNWRIPRGAKDLGYHIARLEAGAKIDPNVWPGKLSIAQQEAWTLRLDLAPGISTSGGFHDRFGSNGRVVTFETLPEPLLGKVRKWADYYKARPEEAAPPIDIYANDDPPG